MKTYRATEVVTLPSGSVVRLDEKQAARRKGRVTPAKDKGVYVLKDALQFKAGETFGYEGELPKVIAADLEPVKAAADEKPSGKADKKAAGK